MIKYRNKKTTSIYIYDQINEHEYRVQRKGDDASTHSNPTIQHFNMIKHCHEKRQSTRVYIIKRALKRHEKLDAGLSPSIKQK